MSLLTTASPYHSREDGNEMKNNKKTTIRRKATMPSTSLEAKNYMSQLIQNKEPPSIYSYSSSSSSSDMLYPTLEESSTKNISNNTENENEKKEGEFGYSLQGEEILRKNDILPPPPQVTEMPSFYKTNKTQQNSVTSALQKLTGSKTITQEGMMDIGSSGTSSEVETTYKTPYMPRMPAFTMNQTNEKNEKGGDMFTPIDYLKSSPSSPTMFSDYSSSYSSSNYVVPPNLSQYSYPIMRPSAVNMEYQHNYNHEENDRTQQLLLEKINYMIYLLEHQKKEKSKHTTEEFVLYSFLGVFVIYIADSFARSGRYIR